MRVTRIIVIVIIVFMLGCSKNEKAQEEGVLSEEVSPKGSSQQEDADQKILTFSLSGTEQGKKRWDITGESADILSSDVVELTNIVGKTYTEDSVITITADKGKFDKSSNNMELKKNVVALTEDGAELTTEHLNWNAQKELIWTEDFVQVQKDEVKTTGYGMEARPNLEKVEFKRDVKVNIDPSTVITCDGPLQIDYKESIAYLNKNVQVIDERGELAADKARVYFDREEKKIIKVIAEGNVKIKRDGSVTYSDTAIYYADEMKIVLTGRPKFVIYPENKEEEEGNGSNTH